MTVHINEVSGDLTAIASDLPLSSEQLDKLVRLVLNRLDQRQREAETNHEATAIRHQLAPGLKEEC